MNVRSLSRSPVARALAAFTLVLAIGCAFSANGAFFTWETHQALLRQVAVPGILACGMTLVILTGGIDLAVGSELALAAVLFSIFAMSKQWGALPAIAATLAIGAALGAVSGAFVARFRLQPFIVTLAAMVFARGFAKYVAAGKKVTTWIADTKGGGHSVPVPKVFEWLDHRVFGDSIAVVALLFLACVALTWVVLAKMKVGRWIYAVGGSSEAARLSGVPVRGVLVLAYAASGLFAALAGICQAAQEMQGDPETGLGYELDAIAMVVIGGTSLNGGRGGVGLTLLGVLTIGYLEKILSLNAFSTDARMMLTGGIIVAAALFQKRGK